MRLLASVVLVLALALTPSTGRAQTQIDCSTDVQPQGRITIFGRTYHVYVTLMRWIPGAPGPDNTPWVTANVTLFRADGQPVAPNIPRPIAIFQFRRERWRPSLESTPQTAQGPACTVGFNARGDIDWPDGANVSARLTFMTGFFRWRTINVPVQLETVALP